MLSLSGLPMRDTRGNWVRLRTLILLRWIAISGQFSAILLADQVLGVALPLGLCLMVVGASVILNLVSGFVFPESKRLSEMEAMLALLFDLAQLSFLLYLTGGLTNPFALLVLGPVMISASTLSLQSTFLLGALAIVFITLTGFVHLPLVDRTGGVLTVPVLFEIGFWLSIVIGIVFLGLYSRRISMEMRSMADALLATQMALAREQKLTDLGGVVAAAAHELGTPLATITLVSTEMIDDLSDRPELAEDARLIRQQADRCRDILRSMGRAGKDDLHMRYVPLAALLREAAEPHQARGKDIVFNLSPVADGTVRQPTVHRRPETIHGLRNLVQNAVDFAKSTVWIDGEWSADRIIIRVVDDGDGYPGHVLGRIGDPFVRSRRLDQEAQQRPEYEGMGLGLFIAKTLLERTGATLTFANAGTLGEDNPRRGAVVELVWAAEDLAISSDAVMGENKAIDI